MARKRVQFRPPGLKPTTKVGTLGPYRGRLGLAWVIAPLVAGIVIVVAGLLDPDAVGPLLDGYCWPQSVLPGEEVALHVSSSGPFARRGGA